MVLSVPASRMNQTAVRACSKQFNPPANLRTNPAAIKASKVLPVAIPNEVPHEPCVVRLTRKAPTKIPGHSRYPQRRIVASAMPVGGQTAEALPFTMASDNPNLPEKK